MAKKDIEKKPPMADGLDPVESPDPGMTIGDYASREEAVWAARELLRKEAQDGLNRRLGINPKEIVGVRFVKSWRNYFADGRVYGFSKKAAGALVAGRIAVLDGVPDPHTKKTAQDAVDEARARREAKAKKADEEAEFEAELKAEAEAKAKADKKK